MAARRLRLHSQTGTAFKLCRFVLVCRLKGNAAKTSVFSRRFAVSAVQLTGLFCRWHTAAELLNMLLDFLKGLAA